MPRGRCACCSSRFPPIPIRARRNDRAGNSPARRFAHGAARRHAIHKRQRTSSCPSPDTYDVAIAALFVRVADRKGNVGFPDDQRAFVNQLLAAGKPVVVASFGSPYLIERFPNAKTWLAEFSTNDVSQRAVARALFGQIAIAGTIPVTVPGPSSAATACASPPIPMTLQPAPARCRGAPEARLRSARPRRRRRRFSRRRAGRRLERPTRRASVRQAHARREISRRDAPTRSTTSPRSPSPSSPRPPS